MEMKHDGNFYFEVSSRQFMMMKNKQKRVNRKVSIILREVTHVVFTQVSANQGFRNHGQKSVSAIFKELNQLDIGAVKGKPVIQDIEHSTSSKKERSFRSCKFN